MNPSEAETLVSLITKLVDPESHRSDSAETLAALEKIDQRLAKLERKMDDREPASPIALNDHPSLDKLNIAEAIADTIFDGRYKEKACRFEPDKPCDHCSMCNTRGF